jgi:hypothetical protein
MENTAYNEAFAGPLYPRFLCVVTQYVAKFSTAKLERFIRDRQNAGADPKASKKMFHFRMTKPETALELTGYEKNEVFPLRLNCAMPIVLARSISLLPHGLFCMGAGHLQLKL